MWKSTLVSPRTVWLESAGEIGKPGETGGPVAVKLVCPGSGFTQCLPLCSTRLLGVVLKLSGVGC